MNTEDNPRKPSAKLSERFARLSIYSILLGLFIMILSMVMAYALFSNCNWMGLIFYAGLFLLLGISPLFGIITLLISFRPVHAKNICAPEIEVDRIIKKRNSIPVASLLFTIVGTLVYIAEKLAGGRMWGLGVTLWLHMPLVLGLLLGVRAYVEMRLKQIRVFYKYCCFSAIAISFIVMIFAFGVPMVNYLAQTIKYAQQRMAYDGDSKGLKQTIVVPTLDVPVAERQNIIWCSSFQLAWNKLKEDVVKEPVEVVGAMETAERLNSAEQSAKDIAADSYYAAAGIVRDGIIETIYREMSERFPSHIPPKFANAQSDWIIAYSYMEATAKFTTPFLEDDEGLLFKASDGNECRVNAFGVWDGFLPGNEKIREQVEILYVKSDGEKPRHRLKEFAIDLCKHTKTYQVIVACIEPGENLQKSVEYLESKISSFSSDEDERQLDGCDILVVPELFWQIKHRFGELIGKTVGNKNYSGMPIVEAMQDIQFKLDRNGAILKSESALAVAAIPRHFIFDRPFLIYMKMRGATFPFFVMWVDNAELLMKK